MNAATRVCTNAQVDRVAADPASNTTVGTPVAPAGPGSTIAYRARPSRVRTHTGSPWVCTPDPVTTHPLPVVA